MATAPSNEAFRAAVEMAVATAGRRGRAITGYTWDGSRLEVQSTPIRVKVGNRELPL